MYIRSQNSSHEAEASHNVLIKYPFANKTQVVSRHFLGDQLVYPHGVTSLSLSFQEHHELNEFDSANLTHP